MRIWSIHPKYLDAKGLVALWRETLLAKKVLLGETKGYLNHPQLNRFKLSENPADAIDQYLVAVFHEASLRQYNFNRKKINWDSKPITIKITRGQIDYEIKHLMKKLSTRDPKKYKEIRKIKSFNCHPLFRIVDGPVASWEISAHPEEREGR
ncbi:MAG TPA: pyrimidine dimer DNA glycosylase/endonuclease V [Puia sp.]|nr:pyrimidine dimer DNA glycosylase/endonuclease V [Puia sp.]